MLQDPKFVLEDFKFLLVDCNIVLADLKFLPAKYKIKDYYAFFDHPSNSPCSRIPNSCSRT